MLKYLKSWDDGGDYLQKILDSLTSKKLKDYEFYTNENFLITNTNLGKNQKPVKQGPSMKITLKASPVLGMKLLSK